MASAAARIRRSLALAASSVAPIWIIQPFGTPGGFVRRAPSSARLPWRRGRLRRRRHGGGGRGPSPRAACGRGATGPVAEAELSAASASATRGGSLRRGLRRRRRARDARHRPGGAFRGDARRAVLVVLGGCASPYSTARGRRARRRRGCVGRAGWSERAAGRRRRLCRRRRGGAAGAASAIIVAVSALARGLGDMRPRSDLSMTAVAGARRAAAQAHGDQRRPSRWTEVSRLKPEARCSRS